jgi:hypothetical protein
MQSLCASGWCRQGEACERCGCGKPRRTCETKMHVTRGAGRRNVRMPASPYLLLLRPEGSHSWALAGQGQPGCCFCASTWSVVSRYPTDEIPESTVINSDQLVRMATFCGPK